MQDAVLRDRAGTTVHRPGDQLVLELLHRQHLRRQLDIAVLGHPVPRIHVLDGDLLHDRPIDGQVGVLRPAAPPGGSDDPDLAVLIRQHRDLAVRIADEALGLHPPGEGVGVRVRGHDIHGVQVHRGAHGDRHAARQLEVLDLRGHIDLGRAAHTVIGHGCDDRGTVGMPRHRAVRRHGCDAVIGRGPGDEVEGQVVREDVPGLDLGREGRGIADAHAHGHVYDLHPGRILVDMDRHLIGLAVPADRGQDA